MNFKEYLILDEATDLLLEVDMFLEVDQQTSKYIDPLTNKNWRSVDKWRQLAAIVKQESSKKENPTKPNRIWITFSDVSRLGLPQSVSSGKSTPYGVFAYPATFILNKVQRGSENFYGVDRQYMIVFKVKKAMAEIGEKKYDTQDRFGKDMKDDLHKSVNNTIANHIEKVRVELSGFLYTWLNHFTSNHFISNLHKRELHDLVLNILNQVMRNLQYANDQSALQKLSKQDIRDMFDVDKVRKDAYHHAQSELRLTLDNLYVPGSYMVNRYINIHDDLSAELSPEFKNYIKNTEDANYYFHNAKDMDLDGRKSFDWLLAFDHKTFDVYYNKNRVKDFQNARPDNKESIYNSPYLNKLFNILAMKAKKMFDSYDVKPISQMNYPMKPELNMLAGQYGVNIDNIIKNVMNGSVSVLNGRQFIYQITKEMAREASTKLDGTNWQSIWSKMLRQLGWDHAVDTKYSGSIHSSEPTQGVFMDPTKIEQIGLILNKSHVGYEDMSQRPNLTNKIGWHGSNEDKLRSRQHSRTAGPQIMRKGPMAGGTGNPAVERYRAPFVAGKTAAQRTLINLNARLEQFAKMLSPWAARPRTGLSVGPQSKYAEGWIVMLAKLIKTAKTTKDLMVKGTTKDKDWSLIKQMEELLVSINFKIKKLPAEMSMSASVKQVVDNIITMTEKGAQSVEIPHFSRPFWKQASFQKQFPQPVNNAEVFDVLTANDVKGSGYFVDGKIIGLQDNDIYFGPFASLVKAVTACVLVTGKKWDLFWYEVRYLGKYDIKEFENNGWTILVPQKMTLNSSVSKEKITSLISIIRQEAEDVGYI